MLFLKEISLNYTDSPAPVPVPQNNKPVYTDWVGMSHDSIKIINTDDKRAEGIKCNCVL